MKNKILTTIFTIIVLTENMGLCNEPNSSVLHTGMIKFGLAMGGVALSSIIIFAGLSIYNKIFVKTRKHSVEEEILKTPKTTDDAIKFFIHKNKLN